jgi:hypothetical protein
VNRPFGQASAERGPASGAIAANASPDYPRSSESAAIGTIPLPLPLAAQDSARTSASTSRHASHSLSHFIPEDRPSLGSGRASSGRGPVRRGISGAIASGHMTMMGGDDDEDSPRAHEEGAGEGSVVPAPGPADLQQASWSGGGSRLAPTDEAQEELDGLGSVGPVGGPPHGPPQVGGPPHGPPQGFGSIQVRRRSGSKSRNASGGGGNASGGGCNASGGGGNASRGMLATAFGRHGFVRDSTDSQSTAVPSGAPSLQQPLDGAPPPPAGRNPAPFDGPREGSEPASAGRSGANP